MPRTPSPSNLPSSSRSISPIHFSIHMHIPRPVSPLHLAAPNQPKPTRAAAVSRLLDPAYSPVQISSDSSTTRAYVDRHGVLHDPDYRQFPLVPTKRAPPRTSRTPWALLDLEDEADLEPEEDIVYSRRNIATRYNNSRRDWGTGATRDSSFTESYHRAYPVQGYQSQFSSSTTSSNTTYSHSSTGISPPTSFESDETIFEDSVGSYDDEKDCRKCIIPGRKRRRLSKAESEKEKERDSEQRISRVRSSSPLTSSRTSNFSLPRTSNQYTREDMVDEEPVNLEQEPEEAQDAVVIEQTEWVPTCTQGVRRQWQAVSLSIRFGVFRARRRFRQRVQSML